MTYNIIGAGNIAWFFAPRLTAAGHQCTGIYSRDRKNAEALAEVIHCNIYDNMMFVPYDNPDLCFLAIPYHDIEPVASQLFFKDSVLVHTSGSVGIEALARSTKDHAVLWPMYSILKNNLPDHRNIPCGWEASTDRAKRYILSAAHAITDVLFEARGDNRKWLHLSAVLSNNFTNHLVAICEKICATHNVPFNLLYPIIEQTADRLRNYSPYNMQSGPAKRGDAITIQKHVEMLQSHPDWQQLYVAITNSIENMYGVHEPKEATT